MLTVLALLAAAPAWTSQSSFYELREGSPNLCGVGMGRSMSSIGETMAVADARRKLTAAIRTRVTQTEVKTPDGKVVTIKTESNATVSGIGITDKWVGDGKTFSKGCLDLRAAAASFATGDGDVAVEGLSKDQNKALTEFLLHAGESELKKK